MMIFQLSTHSEDKLLETGGMVFLEATSQGRILKIEEGKDIVVGLPTNELKEGMQLFDGEKKPNDDINWVATNQGFAQAPFDFEEPVLPKMPFSRFRYLIKQGDDGLPVLSDKQAKNYRNSIPKLMLYIDLVELDKPKKPKEPTLDKIRYRKKKKKLFFKSKRKIEKEILTIYSRRMKVYERKLAEYNLEIEKYEEDSANYPKWIEYQKQIIEIASGKFIDEFEKDYKKTGEMPNKELKNYFFKHNFLGWINCDRFYNLPSDEKMILTINDADNQDELVMIAFNQLNSCIQPNRKNKTSFVTNLIPKAAEITIIGMKVIDGKNFIAKQKTRADAQSKYDLVYRELESVEELQELLKL